MENKNLRRFDELGRDEQIYALEMIRKRPVWNVWLDGKIRERLLEEFDKSEIREDILYVADFDRYSSIEGWNYGGEVAIRIQAEICAALEDEMDELIRMVYGMDEDAISKTHPEHIFSIKIGIYGDTALAEVTCTDEKKAFPTEDLSREWFENDLEVFFAAFSSALESSLTLYSRELRKDENVVKYIEESGIRFDERLRVAFD